MPQCFAPYKNIAVQKVPALGAQSQFTVKTLNIGTPRPAAVVVLNIKQFNFTSNAVMPPKEVERMANSVDPDQTAP